MNREKETNPILSALDSFSKRKPAYFSMPGHRFGRGVSKSLKDKFSRGIFRYDLTENYGLDDLHNAKGIIKASQDKAAELYGSLHARFLVNGSTSGILAFILATCGEKDEIIVDRGCHVSVVSGLILTGAIPVWTTLKTDENLGIPLETSVNNIKNLIERHRRVKAVIITSPTYYGNLAGIGEIAEECHKYNIPLIVDEAHGAHLYFTDRLPKGAMSHGADGVVMSLHKTLGAMTSTALLHVCSSRIDMEKIDRALDIVTTSSPSYILMTSIETVIEDMAKNGRSKTDRAVELALYLRRGIEKIPGFSAVGGSNPKTLIDSNRDCTRVVIYSNRKNISGFYLGEILFEKYNVAVEMGDFRTVVLIITSGNTKKDIDRLLAALEDIDRSTSFEKEKNTNEIYKINLPCPKISLSPEKAFFAPGERVDVGNALGRISASSVSIYPPGIPLVNPGEELSPEVCKIMEWCIKEDISLHGLRDTDKNTLEVVKE